jgi:hypothetical protein
MERDMSMVINVEGRRACESVILLLFEILQLLMDEGYEVGMGWRSMVGGRVRVLSSDGWYLAARVGSLVGYFARWTRWEASWKCRSVLRLSRATLQSFWCIARLDAIILSVLAAKSYCVADSRYETLI